MILVMYHAEKDLISTWQNNGKWDGYIPWATIEACIHYGWEVIGEL